MMEAITVLGGLALIMAIIVTLGANFVFVVWLAARFL